MLRLVSLVLSINWSLVNNALRGLRTVYESSLVCGQNEKGVSDRKYVLSKISLTRFVVRTTILNSNKIQGESEMMATKESLRVMEYDKENTVRVYLKLNKKHDADVIAKLNEVDSKQRYIKDLIRKDIGEYGETKTEDFTGDGG